MMIAWSRRPVQLERSGAQSVSRREQWEMGNNTLVLAPGVVVAFEHNTATNACLEDAGIEVLGVPGSELARGHGYLGARS